MKPAKKGKEPSPLKDLTRRDYLVAAGIILGVLAIWFLLMAVLLHLVDVNDGIFIAVVLGAGIYFLIKNKSKES